MNASDIPVSYSSPNRMARGLASYIDCPKTIQRRVADVFNTSPCLKSIIAMRAQFLRQDSIVMQAKDAWQPQKEQEAMADISRKFLKRLDAERKRSAALKRAQERFPALFSQAA